MRINCNILSGTRDEQERQKIESNRQVAAFRQEVLSCKDNAIIFKRKVREEKERLNALRIICHILAQEKANSVGNDCFVADYWFDKKIAEKELCIAKIKRFEWYVKMCQGKVQTKKESINILGAKQVLISEVLPFNPAQKQVGRWKYLCPLHTEKTPSFTYYVEQNRWHCYGCSMGGDVIDLVMKLQGVSFPDAVKQLAP